MGVFLSKKDMSDLLITAWEGGSNYWVEVAKYEPPAGMSKAELKQLAWDALPFEEKDLWKTPQGVPLYAMLAYLPPSVKWRIAFEPNEVIKGKGEVYYLTPKGMREAAPKLAKAHPHIYKRIREEGYDAGDADAWLQMAIFDEVIFG